MITMIDIIKCNIHRCSTRIKQIKETAKMFPEPFFINPKHPHWAEYSGLKHEVSIWLTVLHLTGARQFAGAHPSSHHNIDFKVAQRRLQQLEKDIQNGRKFPEVVVYIEEREKARAERGEQC